MLEIKQHSNSQSAGLFSIANLESPRSNTEARSRNTFKHRSSVAHDTVTEIARKYKNISIFNWYTPQSFRPMSKGKYATKKLSQATLQNSRLSQDK